MRLLRNLSSFACALLVLTVVAGAAQAQDKKPAADWSRRLTFASADGRFTLQLSNRLQVRFDDLDFTPDPAVPAGQGSSSDTSTFRLRRARTTLEGKAFGDVAYKLQLDWVTNPAILDAEVRYTKYPLFQPWLGRGKAFFGRQQLVSSGRQQFVDRSIVDGAFFPGRQNGVALVGELPNKVLEYQVGVYNGNGIANNALNDDDQFMTTQRVVWQPFGPMPLEEGGTPYAERFELSIGAAALQNTTRSTPTTATSTSPSTFDDADVSRLGLELAMGYKGFSAVAEYVTEEQDNRKRTTVAAPAVVTRRADQDRDGLYAQVGYLFLDQKLEVAVRHAEIDTETPRFGSAERSEQEQTEDRVALSWYVAKHDCKLQVDYGTLETKNVLTGATILESDELRAQFQIAF